MDLDVVLLNETPTYFEPERRYYSTLDLTFCSSELALQSCWRVDLDTWSSDHFLVFFNIGLNVLDVTGSRPDFYSSNIDWERFQSIVNSKIQDQKDELYYSICTIEDI